MVDVPAPLVEAILEGSCIAFVGAGFAAPCVPSWRSLLESLAEGLPPASRSEVQELFGHGEAPLTNEAVAQALQHHLGPDRFHAELARLVGSPEPDALMQRRITHLRGIPFRGVLTTNFDGLLDGEAPCPKAYRMVLRPSEGLGWFRARYWRGGTGTPVVKIHGDARLRNVVFTRRAYRERLYGDLGYQSFLRAVFATTTVLFLGVSFSDPYVVELRSEVLALLGQSETDAPVAYALVNDEPPARVDFYRRHEGIALISYASQSGHDAFDAWLEELYRRTNPLHHLAELLAGRRILWLDPNPRNNAAGISQLRAAAKLAGLEAARFEEVHDVEHALTLLGASPWDVVITHWGWSAAAPPNAERLLREMRRRDLAAPVVVFGRGQYADENKKRALASGAVDYVFSWSALLRRIEDLFSPGSVTG
jgi:CheY-like chemotaxis protein